MSAGGNDKKQRAQATIVLVCILAVCCTVMYLSAEEDGFKEVMYKSSALPRYIGGASVKSLDQLKTGQIYSETPDGLMRLMDYFVKVEKEINMEVTNRKNDITSLRAQMARDFAFNQAARAKMKKHLMAKMAANAKAAHDALQAEMRRTHERFAKQAALANKRNAANIARAKATMKAVAANKREAAHNLRMAVQAQQRAQAAFAAGANAHINQLNKHVAANAAQIKENAKKARKALESAMNTWNKKLAHFKSAAAKGRSKLAAQMVAMNKRTRQFANNKVQGLVASTAAQFRRVRSAMAKQRHAVDMAVKHSTTRFHAALNAQKALADRRYASTVKDIAAARSQANKQMANAKMAFKVSLLKMQSVVKQQVAKFNKRTSDLSNVVQSNKAAQSEINRNVNAEMSRMVKLGNKRYTAQLKHDRELKRLINKNRAQTDSRLTAMAHKFNNELSAVRKQMAKDRAHNERALANGTSKLWAALQKQQEFMRKMHAKNMAATRRMKLDMMDATRHAKEKFVRKIHHLGKKVAAISQKYDKKVRKLTGVVVRNAQKSAQGRKLLRMQQSADKAELKDCLRKAISKGEARAKKLEAKSKKLNVLAQTLMNNKLGAEISNLAKQAHGSLTAIALQSKSAIKAMKQEMVYAVKSAAKVAKADMALSIRAAAKQLTAIENTSAKYHSAAASKRRKMAAELARNRRSVKRMVAAAVATQARALLALKTETAKRIKSSNSKVTAYAKQMRKAAQSTAMKMKMQLSAISNKIGAEKRRAAAAASAVHSQQAARGARAMKFLQKAVAKARQESNKKFGNGYKILARARAAADQFLAGSVATLNDRMAAQGALIDSRFSNTVKNMAQAKKKAAADVKKARSAFVMALAVVTSHVKNVESKLAGDIAVVSGEVVSDKAMQYRINRHVNAELKRIVRIADSRRSIDRRARGKLRSIMNQYKKAASRELMALSKVVGIRLTKVRSAQARARLETARDLSKATKKFFLRVAALQNAQAKINHGSKMAAAKIHTERAAVQRARGDFSAQLNMLANIIVATSHQYGQALKRLTKVHQSVAKQTKFDQRMFQEQVAAMQADMNMALVRSVNIGEARGKADSDRLAIKHKGTKRFRMVEVAEKIERSADKVFMLIQGNRQKIADNYLSVKAYAGSVGDRIVDHILKGKGKALSSIGDFLSSVASVSSVRPSNEYGLGMGGKRLQPLFSGKQVAVDSMPQGKATVNGLVKEYVKICVQVRRRWPMGLGRYLLFRLERSMMEKGVLEVDKLTGKRGHFVFVNARAVGLSSKLPDFTVLAAPMKQYTKFLAKITAKITKSKSTKRKVELKGPQWMGK